MRSSGDGAIFEEHVNTPEARAVVKRPLSGNFVIWCATFGAPSFVCSGSNGFVARVRRWIFYNVGHAIVRFSPTLANAGHVVSDARLLT